MGNSSVELPANLEVLLDIPVKLSVELGACQLSMQEVLQLGPGSVVPLDRRADAPVDLFVNQKLVARGEVVVMDDQFGIRITEVAGKAAGEQASAQPAPASEAVFVADGTTPAPAPPRATAPAVETAGKQF